jgi:hypothetical protein
MRNLYRHYKGLLAGTAAAVHEAPGGLESATFFEAASRKCAAPDLSECGISEHSCEVVELPILQRVCRSYPSQL